MKNVLNYLLNKEWILSIVMFFLSDETKKHIYIAKLRVEMLFWGYDISGMSDEQIEQGVVIQSIVFAEAGLTLDQCAKAFKQLSMAFKNK